uniref:Arrestin C-terminal-like domain-containing protein n=1 Tax=Ditylenchus dipsaci TaxID=166011 RepID=A0A915DAA8_9BILA
MSHIYSVAYKDNNISANLCRTSQLRSKLKYYCVNAFKVSANNLFAIFTVTYFPKLPYNYNHSKAENRAEANTMSNINDSHPTSSLSEFSIELDDASDGCYRPGQTINGNVVVGMSSTSAPIEIVLLKLRFCGRARIKGKVKGIDPNSEQIYLKDDLELVSQSSQPITIGANKHELFRFQKKLKKELYTSVESKSASIVYCIRAYCTYRTQGILGGQIKLNFSLSRSAFVCGENITIEGRIENKTDRRVDKVAAVLQQVIVIYGDENHLKDSELNLLDVSDIHEDNLALFVDEGASVKIERNFALPPFHPGNWKIRNYQNVELCSTHSMDGCETADGSAQRRRISLSVSRLSFSSSKIPTMLNSQNSNSRFLKILYQLSVRVKTGGVEVMEINVPIMIGSVPHDDHQNRKAQLNYTNKYPYFVDLPSSSKQSRKVSMLANAMKAETTVAKRPQSGVEHAKSQVESYINNQSDSSVTVRSPPNRTFVDRPCRHLPKVAGNGLTPVEILITDHKLQHKHSLHEENLRHQELIQMHDDQHRRNSEQQQSSTV